MSKDNNLKKGFFKKIWYSIYKIEKYDELAAEGLGRALKYFLLLIVIMAVVSSSLSLISTTKVIYNISKYIEEKVPELTYKEDEGLKVNSEEPIIDEDSEFGKIIIDTNQEKEDIEQYFEGADENKTLIIILKDKMIIKQPGYEYTETNNYKETFEQLHLTEFNKDSLISYLRGKDMLGIYMSLELTYFLLFVGVYLVNLVLILMISVFGYLATKIIKLNLRFVAVFNMAIYSVTLPTILQTIYIIVNYFSKYTINNLEYMYIFVSTVYTVAALFIIKSESDKTQGEVQKVVEVEEKIKKEIEEKDNKEDKKEKRDKKENKDNKDNKEEKDKKDTKKNNSKDNKKEKENTSGEEQPGEA